VLFIDRSTPYLLISASEKVVFHLVTQNFLPILLYGTEACPLNKPDMNSFDFAFDQLWMKLFETNNIKIIEECHDMFGVFLLVH